MKITIIYDNEARREDLVADWGFSCLVEAHRRRILFDTGTKGRILLDNMRKLGIDPSSIQEVVISHDHGDHMGGLADFLAENKARVYVPSTCGEQEGAAETVVVREPVEIHEGIHSTGTLAGVEQSLAVTTEKGVVVVVGCSHSGVGEILKAASRVGKVRALIGGLHGFSAFDLVKDIEMVCATHCTQHKAEIRSLYPDKFVEGGAGHVIEL